jgi:two-component system, NarL family, nitrate/nitrite response regulator NarL
MEGLRRLLESAEGLRIVAAESSLPEGMTAVRELKPSMLMVDKSFGIQAVMELLKDLRSSDLGTHTIVWSATISDSEALRLIQAGASGVIRKSAPLAMLLTCLKTVASGNTWMQEDTIVDADRPIRQIRSPLTPRELQVMEHIERGLKNKDIASALGIRTGTVKIHLKHIFEKTGIRGRYGLALSGLKEKGLLALSTAVDDAELTLR